GGCQRTRLRRLLAPEVDRLSRERDDPAVAVAEPGMTAQQRKRIESICPDETVTLPFSAPSYVIENYPTYIRTHVTVAGANPDAVAKGFDVEVQIGAARRGADLAARLRKRYLPNVQQRTSSHYESTLRTGQFQDTVQRSYSEGCVPKALRILIHV